MTALPVVLDSAALSEIALPGPGGPSAALRALLEVAWKQQRPVLAPAVVCAETCRGLARTRSVEALLSRHDAARLERSPIRVVDTNFELARLVGTVLFASDAGSEDIVDAHVVAICVHRGGGLIVTSDPEDMDRLKQPFLGVRIVVRSLR
jgi:predicted nucleic acid-binding protein